MLRKIIALAPIAAAFGLLSVASAPAAAAGASSALVNGNCRDTTLTRFYTYATAMGSFAGGKVWIGNSYYHIDGTIKGLSFPEGNHASMTADGYCYIGGQAIPASVQIDVFKNGSQVEVTWVAKSKASGQVLAVSGEMGRVAPRAIARVSLVGTAIFQP